MSKTSGLKLDDSRLTFWGLDGEDTVDNCGQGQSLKSFN